MRFSKSQVVGAVIVLAMILAIAALRLFVF
jgi:hypothetical protein